MRLKVRKSSWEKNWNIKAWWIQQRLSPQWSVKKGRGHPGGSCREHQRLRFRMPHWWGPKHVPGRTVRQPRASCLSLLAGEKEGNTRHCEMFQLAHLAINAFFKFLSSVILGQCFAVSAMGLDATGQMHLLLGNRRDTLFSLYAWSGHRLMKSAGSNYL